MESTSALFLRDPVSSITHFAASVFAIYATLILWRLTKGDQTKRVSLAVFAVSAVLLYTASGVYHAIPLPKTSATVSAFRRLDHSAIYLLIAGTYTPIFAVLLRGRRRVIFLSLIWGLAGIGMASKWVVPIGSEKWTIGLYLALGWVFIFALSDLFRAVGWSGVFWGAGGGFLYMAGAFCELFKWPVIVPGVVGWHEVCHLFDIAGTTFHLVFMIRCVLPYRAPVDNEVELEEPAYACLSA